MAISTEIAAWSQYLESASKRIEDAIVEHVIVIQSLNQQATSLIRIADSMCRTVLSGNKILWCGNGGSAADAQHLAAELVGRFTRERPSIPSIALTTDTSILTAIGNDYAYDQIFSRQVEALCGKNDLLVGITTSGNSKNVCTALQKARDIGAFTVAFTGESGGIAGNLADLTLRVGSSNTARTQEAHILCGHILCDWIEDFFCRNQSEYHLSR